MWRFGLLLLGIASLIGACSGLGLPATKRLEERLAQGKCAVVTVVTAGSGFVAGASVLGRSLSATNTQMKLVALIANSLDVDDRRLLYDSGWELREGQVNEEEKREFISTKLQIFNLVEFERVIFMDADMLVIENIDELCSCNADYCAVVRNTFFNAGLLVVRPAAHLFVELKTAYALRVNNVDDDQGFLNQFFWTSERCPYYEPLEDLSKYKDGDVPTAKCYRLPGYYNGDVGFAVARDDRWQFDPNEARTSPKVMHFTMLNFKPWMWWSYIAVSDSWHWWSIWANDSQEFLVRRVAFFLQALPFVGYWVLCLMHFSSVSGWMLPLVDFFHRPVVGLVSEALLSSRMRRCVVGHLCNVVCLVAACFYASFVLIHPTINLSLFVVTYLTLFEFVCVQLWQHGLSRACGILSPSFDALTTNLYRLWSLITVCSTAYLIWGQFFNFYTRVICIVVWAVLSPTIGHTTFCQITPKAAEVDGSCIKKKQKTKRKKEFL